MRPAQISDCRNKFGLDSLRRNNGKSAHPYYAIADFNQDKIGDFVVVLYDAKQDDGGRFRLAIFNGDKSGNYKMEYEVGNMDLRQGGIWTDGFGATDNKPTVTAGVFETDDAIWIEWADDKYVGRYYEEN